MTATGEDSANLSASTFRRQPPGSGAAGSIQFDVALELENESNSMSNSMERIGNWVSIAAG
jgi:hypothetical protein